jgi:cell division protein FtsI (penicillin-binding protein 3)
MRGILEGVVKHGTARNMQSPLFTSAGKTGTAQIFEQGTKKNKEGKTRHQITFCGYFPADNPMYTCIVYARDYKRGGTGTICGEVYKKVAEKAYIMKTQRNDSITNTTWQLSDAKQHTPAKEELDTQITDVIPNVKGWDIQKALYVLENQNITVTINGSGLVKEQSILPGTPTENVHTITLTCQQ